MAMSPTGNRATAGSGAMHSPVPPAVERDLGAWRQFVREQERLCAEHRFPAALVTIGLDQATDLDAAIDALTPALRSTDHVGVLCATELSVLLVPLESIQHAQRVVLTIDGAVRGAKIAAHIGWAMRQDDHGLFHAAARADAAMLSARGHGQASVDLADR
jgi:hypothetical protein